ncbi:MAG: hypothetical protein JWO45_410 [Spartobacteria bacterium]|nr:hypothetical protein [Spartobacteria bacterium]
MLNVQCSTSKLNAQRSTLEVAAIDRNRHPTVIASGGGGSVNRRYLILDKSVILAVRESKAAASGYPNAAAEIAIACFLEREGQTAANHAEVVLRAIDNVPTEIIGPTDVPGDAELDSAANLAH